MIQNEQSIYADRQYHWQQFSMPYCGQHKRNRLLPKIISSNTIHQIQQQFQQKHPYLIKINKMLGRYSDTRVYQHFVHTYSRVPYLDSEIFNVQTNALRESRRANQRAVAAIEGLQRTKLQSEKLQTSLRNSRIRKDQDAKQFLVNLQISQQNSLARQKLTWSNYSRQREEAQLSHIKDQQYLSSLLKSNSTKAESRLTSVRRWN